MRIPRTSTRARSVLLTSLALLFLAAPHAHAGTGFRVFSDSPIPDYWDTSWGTSGGGSFVELRSGTKFPVDTVRRSGANALRLTWYSAPGGDWALCAATAGWSPGSLDGLDSLLFWMRAPSGYPSAQLPLVFLEDASNVRTGKRPLALSVPAVTGGVWMRVSVPLDFFRANPNGADLTRINKVFFGQDPANPSAAWRTLYLDELRFVATDTVPPPAPVTPAVRGFERHIDLTWGVPADPDIESVRIERLDGGTWRAVGSAPGEDGAWPDWIGATGISAQYRLVAVDWSFHESPVVGPLAAATVPMSDEALMDMTEEATFRFFWNHAHPVSGLIRERYGSGEICATGGTGFGVMAILAAAERGWVTRSEALARVRQVTEFYAYTAERFHGAFPHWVNGTTGAHVPFLSPADDMADIVETAYLIEGLLAARQYFDGAGADEDQLRSLVDLVWRRVEWDAFRPAGSNSIWWHRSPTTGFAGSQTVQGWNECMIVYLLAKASPTHSVPAFLYHAGWARSGAIVNGSSYYGHPLPVGSAWGGPLFFAHYTFLGFDPRAKRDAYANYFTQNRNHSLINRDYCVANPLGRAGYGVSAWGLTASDDPWGYGAHAPYSNDNGTLTPSAALSSMPYTPRESMEALLGFYRNHGPRLWGPFGFRDAFNPGQNWYAGSYLAIDQGPIVGMIENHRSALLWNAFMSSPEIGPALDSLGFVADSGAVLAADPRAPASGPRLRAARPNPTAGATALAFDLPAAAHVDLEVLDVQGRRMATLVSGRLEAGSHAARWDGRGADGREAPAGLYLCRLTADGREDVTRIVRVR